MMCTADAAIENFPIPFEEVKNCVVQKCFFHIPSEIVHKANVFECRYFSLRLKVYKFESLLIIFLPIDQFPLRFFGNSSKWIHCLLFESD